MARDNAQESRAPVRPALVVGVVLVATLAVHASAIEAPFVWDDRPLILDSPLVQAAHPLWDYFSRPFWSSPLDSEAARAFYRPVVTLSYRFDHLVAGDVPLAFHATNVLLHVAATGLLFAWMRRLGAGSLAAAAATLGWSLHPRSTESVTWIAGRTDVLAWLFVLGAMLAWPDPASPANRRSIARATAASVLLFFGLLSKEVAVVGALAIGIAELTRASEGAARAKRLAPLAIAVALYGALRYHALHAEHAVSSEPPSRVYTALAALGTYARMVVDPRPNAQIGLAVHPSALAAAVGAIVGALAVWALVHAARNRLPWLAPLSLSLAAVALVLHVVPLPVSVLAADRFLYVPLAGLAAVGALASVRVPQVYTRALGVAAGLVIALFAWRTVERIDDWRDELRFWMVTARAADRDNSLPVTELAGVLYRAKRFEDALLLYATVAEHGGAASADPSKRSAPSNTAACLSLLGHYDEALEIRAMLTAAQPDNPRRHFDEGLVDLHARRFERARESFSRAIALAPAYEEARAMLATTTEAAAAWPSLPVGESGATVRARWLVRIGARPLAQQELRSLLLRPDLPRDVVAEAATFLVEQGDLDAARIAVARAREDGVADASALATRLDEREVTERRIDASLADIRAIATRAAR